MTQIVSWWDELHKVLALNGASTSPLITNHGKGTKNQVIVCAKTILKKHLLRLGNGIRWSQTSLSLVESPLWA